MKSLHDLHFYEGIIVYQPHFYEGIISISPHFYEGMTVQKYKKKPRNARMALAHRIITLNENLVVVVESLTSGSDTHTIHSKLTMDDLFG